ncbi:hypothetical protein HZA41_01980 [Candidatus Peregrinibacteria bacterium]|nr:hypothetical protein [Candidatus Peregrinibacteria bacterium]
MPGQGCDSYRKKWKQWNFDTAYSYPDEYKYTKSKQYVFIPPKHATTRKARYITLGYVNYDGRLQLYYDYDYVSQYAYYDAWVPYNSTTLYGIWKIYLSDVTSNSESTNWYAIAWDAAKVEY